MMRHRESRARRRPKDPSWVKLPDDRLLDIRICDLGLRIEGTIVQQRIDRLYAQLEQRNLAFRPHVWLSDEWFSPDGIPGIAVPFYLTHPRLMKLEQRQMGEVEGGTREWCMRILRHEAGHAIDSAYRLRRKKQWQKVFGKSSTPYPDAYRPKPFSKRYVLHLDLWYAQSHPCEDFAETFAVWLKPGSPWRKQYAGWPALKKLVYVDELMRELGHTKPPVWSRRRVDSLPHLRKTLREHYAERRQRYGIDWPDPYDQDLLLLFSNAQRYADRPSASAVLRSWQSDIHWSVCRWTGQNEYVVDHVLREIITRCRELKLRMHRTAQEVRTDIKILVAVHSANYMHNRRHTIAV
jgi:hypothetical protein